MLLLEDLPLAVGLALDACAVCVARGVGGDRVPRREPLVLALTFGLFQAGMPLVGGLAGGGLGQRVASWAPWLACAILVLLGARMVWSARGEGPPPAGVLTGLTVLALAVATSIDALAAGFSVGLLGRSVAAAAALIGVVTFALSLAGHALGRRLGARLGSGARLAGGLILVGLGFEVLLSA